MDCLDLSAANVRKWVIVRYNCFIILVDYFLARHFVYSSISRETVGEKIIFYQFSTNTNHLMAWKKNEISGKKKCEALYLFYH